MVYLYLSTEAYRGKSDQEHLILDEHCGAVHTKAPQALSELLHKGYILLHGCVCCSLGSSMNL